MELRWKADSGTSRLSPQTSRRTASADIGVSSVASLCARTHYAERAPFDTATISVSALTYPASSRPSGVDTTGTLFRPRLHINSAAVDAFAPISTEIGEGDMYVRTVGGVAGSVVETTMASTARNRSLRVMTPDS